MQKLFEKDINPNYKVSTVAFVLKREVHKNVEKLPVLSVIESLKIANRFPYDTVNSDICTGNVSININMSMIGFAMEERAELFNHIVEHNNMVMKESPANQLYEEICKYMNDFDHEMPSGELMPEGIITEISLRVRRKIHPATVRILFS